MDIWAAIAEERSSLASTFEQLGAHVDLLSGPGQPAVAAWLRA